MHSNASQMNRKHYFSSLNSQKTKKIHFLGPKSTGTKIGSILDPQPDPPHPKRSPRFPTLGKTTVGAQQWSRTLAKLQSYSEASKCSIGTKKSLRESYLASWTIESAVLGHWRSTTKRSELSCRVCFGKIEHRVGICEDTERQHEKNKELLSQTDQEI